MNAVQTAHAALLQAEQRLGETAAELEGSLKRLDTATSNVKYHAHRCANQQAQHDQAQQTVEAARRAYARALVAAERAVED